MTVHIRHYTMIAEAGRGDELAEALLLLSDQIAAQAGSLGTQILRDEKEPDGFVFIEHWKSQDDHKAAGEKLGKGAFAPILALTARPPEGRDLLPL